jgi:hypothetical protein
MGGVALGVLMTLRRFWDIRVRRKEGRANARKLWCNEEPHLRRRTAVGGVHIPGSCHTLQGYNQSGQEPCSLD